MTPDWVVEAFGGEPPAYVHEVVELVPGRPARQWERVRRGRPMESQLELGPRLQGRLAKRAAKDQRHMSRWQAERSAGLARAASPVRHLDPSTVAATPPREIGPAVFLRKRR